MVFQNPESALNRGWTARRLLARSVRKLTGLRGKAVDERVDSSELGRFGWVADPEGNRVELWEPPRAPHS